METASSTRLALPPVDPAVRPLTTEQSRWLAARHSGLPTVARCVTCRGARAFRWYAPGSRREVGEYDCPCQDQYLLHRVLLHAGVGATYQRLGWDDFEHLPPSAEGAVVDYIDHADAYVASGVGVLLHGRRGNGKTLLASLLLRELVGRGHDAYMTSFSSLLDAASAGWTSEEERAWFTRRVRNAGVLVVDDLGRERKRQQFLAQGDREPGGPGVVRTTSQHAETVWEEVVRHRVASSLPTYVTSNLSPEEVSRDYGANAASLLCERSMVVPFEGADRREEVHQRTLAEARAGLTRPVVMA